MQSGAHTVGDGMRRHLVTLERERRNLDRAMELCAALTTREERLDDLDAGALLDEMARMEREGTTFQDKQRGDIRPLRYVVPGAITLLTVLLMAGLIALILWGFSIDTEEAPPLPLLIVLIAIPGSVILGVVLALVQRVRELGRGEMDDARQY